MKKLASTLPNMLLSLTGICLLAATILSFVNLQTEGVIAASKTKALQVAIGQVTPKFDNNPLDETFSITIEGDDLKVFPAKEGDQLVGMAIETITHKGFGGDVRILVGLDKEGKVINYSVLEMNETPGLGDKMKTWFKTDKNKQSILGLDLTKGTLTVSKDGGQVDAITASTISSRAFLDAINKAGMVYEKAIEKLK